MNGQAPTRSARRFAGCTSNLLYQEAPINLCVNYVDSYFRPCNSEKDLNSSIQPMALHTVNKWVNQWVTQWSSALHQVSWTSVNLLDLYDSIPRSPSTSWSFPLPVNGGDNIVFTANGENLYIDESKVDLIALFFGNYSSIYNGANGEISSISLTRDGIDIVPSIFLKAMPLGDSNVESKGFAEIIINDFLDDDGAIGKSTIDYALSYLNVDFESSETASLDSDWRKAQLNLTLTGNQAINGYGNQYNNKITGNDADNTLDGRGGRDVMVGRKGNDTYIVNHAKDVVREGKGAGIDTVRASVSHTLKANVENLVLIGNKSINGNGNNLNNRLTGNGANNVLNGRGGNDRIIGRGGNDSLIGGTGQDTITGGPGADVFIYRSASDSEVGGARRDVITDFDGATGDRIDLSAIDAYDQLAGNQKFTYIAAEPFSGKQGEVRFESGILQANTGSNTNADMEILLRGVASLDSSHLIL